jgi:hypothetical protein
LRRDEFDALALDDLAQLFEGSNELRGCAEMKVDIDMNGALADQLFEQHAVCGGHIHDMALGGEVFRQGQHVGLHAADAERFGHQVQDFHSVVASNEALGLRCF